MKKKIALLLAAVITAAAPMTAFAAADNKYGGEMPGMAGNAGEVSNIPANTLFPQAGLFVGGLQAVNNSSSIIKEQAIDYVIQGTDLVIDLNAGDVIRNGDTFNVNINNGHFWFAEDASATNDRYINLGSANANTTFVKDRTATYNKTSGYTTSDEPSPGKYSVNSAAAATTVAETSGHIRVYNDLQYTMSYQRMAPATGAALELGQIPHGGLVAINDTTGAYTPYVNNDTMDEEMYLGYKIRIANNGATGSATATITFIANVDGSGTNGNTTYGYGDITNSTIRIPLVMKTTSEKDVRAFVYAGTTRALSNVNGEEFKVSTGANVTGTDISTSIVNTSRETTTLGSINVTETAPGVMRSGFFELQLNEGFAFNDDALSILPSNTDWATATFAGYSNDRKSAYFEITVHRPSTGIGGFFVVNGASIRRTTDYYNFTEETVTMTIRSMVNNETVTIYNPNSTRGTSVRVTGNPNIDTRTITVAIFNNYGLLFGFDNTTDKATIAYAGRANVVTPRLRLQETATNSWWTDRTTRFSLTDADGNILESAKIAKIVVSGLDNLTYASGTYSFSEDAQIGYNPYYTFNRSYIELRDIRRTSNYQTAKLNIQFIINTAANFAGEVYVTASGLGIDPDTEVQPVKIADIKAPVFINTRTTDVTIGYQTYKVADVTITEDARGVLRAGKVLSLEVDEFANTGNVSSDDISFNPIASGDVDVDSATTLAFNKVTLGGNRISFAISKPSTRDTAPGIFTVKNLNVKINRSVPYGHYDLIAGGSAIAETYLRDANEASAFFTVKGVVFENYIKVATIGDSKTLARNVILTPGSTAAIVDTREATIDPAPFINDVGRVMIPLRAVSTLFDIPETDVIWDPTTGTATIVIAGTNNDRIVTFTNKSSVMTINGVPVAMVDENGIATTAEITEHTNRMFIPLRQLGVAFGIRVEWDGVNAIFNPTNTQLETI